MPSMRDVFAYLRARTAFLIGGAFAVLMPLLIGFLSGENALYVRYTAALIAFSLLVAFVCDGLCYRRKRRMLRSLHERVELLPSGLPEPLDALCADYDALVRTLSAALTDLSDRNDRAFAESLEYYTLWVHQIKTPIAAMRLLLSDADDALAVPLKRELFSIEQYTDLALSYIKLGDISSDLRIETCDVERIVRAAVRKYALPFVYGRLYVRVNVGNLSVPTDEKWLAFILCQLLSNAVKYTKTGGVSIYSEQNALVVEDTGIGIRKEDLPRIFEKGFTGYNGRLDTRASGVGLYLAKRAATALSIRLDVVSAPGSGTRIMLFFPETDEIALRS